MKNSKTLTKFLFVVLIVIWGAILYQIASAIIQSGDEKDDTSLTLDQNRAKEQNYYKYSEEVRDPFEYHKAEKKTEIKKPVIHPPKPIWTPPPFKLAGIVVNEKKRTALLEGQNGSVSFLQEGDTLSGVKILKIKEKVVMYFYKTQKDEWALP